jgi:hypothetical protein
MKHLIILAIALALTTTMAAQNITATTEDNRKVTLNADGTWQYVAVDTAKQEVVEKKKLDPYDCSNWIKTTEDNVSGTKTTIIKDYLIISNDGGKTGFGISLYTFDSRTFVFTTKAIGASACIKESAKINILFTDGSRIELTTDGKFNCKNDATVLFGEGLGKPKALLLSQLKEKSIATMRVWTEDGYVQQDFDQTQAEHFKNALNCLTK